LRLRAIFLDYGRAGARGQGQDAGADARKFAQMARGDGASGAGRFILSTEFMVLLFNSF